MTSEAIDAGSAGLSRARSFAVLGFVETAIATLMDRRRAARDREELSRLTDRDLADIGVTRGDIERLARDPALRIALRR